MILPPPISTLFPYTTLFRSRLARPRVHRADRHDRLHVRPRRVGDPAEGPARTAGHQRDRKSTRLNSSHSSISYAVFCLKKKKKNTLVTRANETSRIITNQCL